MAWRGAQSRAESLAKMPLLKLRENSRNPEPRSRGIRCRRLLQCNGKIRSLPVAGHMIAKGIITDEEFKTELSGEGAN